MLNTNIPLLFERLFYATFMEKNTLIPVFANKKIKFKEDFHFY